ncbi:hypothetical protein DRN86_00485, partial [Candidatus Geothermarchaeota archaeon]
MRARVIRKATLKEVLEKLKEFERKFGSFDKFSDKIIDEEKEDLWKTYAEWLDLIHAYRDYEESGSLEYYLEEEIEIETLHRIFSRKMAKFIDEISKGLSSISELAKSL